MVVGRSNYSFTLKISSSLEGKKILSCYVHRSEWVSDVSEWTSVWVTGPLLASWFQDVLNHRASYRFFARGRCIRINFLDRNLSLIGFGPSSRRLGKTSLYSKVYRFFGCLLPFFEKLKGCRLFICKCVGENESASFICHANATAQSEEARLGRRRAENVK